MNLEVGSMGKRSLLLLACLVTAAVFAAGTVRAADARTFYMGFMTFLHDIGPRAEAEFRDFVRQNGDIVDIQFEGVPWVEALADMPFHENLMKEWKQQKALVPPGVKLYLGVTPLNGVRAAMADYRGASEHMPLPGKFKGKAFDDPVIMKAYLNYCKRAAEFFQPDFMAIGIETNELYHNAPADWPGYVKLHKYVYRELKRLHRNLPIFTTLTLHSMLNPNWKDRQQMFEAFTQLMDCNDLVVISFYPFFGHLSAEVDEAFAWLTRSFDQFGKPYAVGESGESAEAMRVPFGEHVVTMDGSPELQASFYKKLLALAEQRKFAFVIESIPRDYDARWQKNKDEFPPFFIAWKDCGLIDGEGNKRPAYYTWREYFDMPLKPVGGYK
jgi:hypothetical protein